MTTTNDRLAEIRARLDAASTGTTMDIQSGRSTLRASVSGGDRGRFIGGMGDLVDATVGETGPLTVTVADDEDGQDATLALHARDDLAHLLSLVEQLQGQLDEFATLQDRIPDDGNGDWGLGWDHGYNAALAEVRAMAARPPAQEHASGSNTPDPYTGEGTAPASPHEPAQAAIDTIARVLVGTDWDEEVPYTDIGPRETVAHLAGQIATVLATQPHTARAVHEALAREQFLDTLTATVPDQVDAYLDACDNDPRIALPYAQLGIPPAMIPGLRADGVTAVQAAITINATRSTT